jgi:hypothetical protein
MGIQSGAWLESRFLVGTQTVTVSETNRGIVMVLSVPIPRDLLVMFVKPSVILAILVVSILTVLAIPILVAVLVISILIAVLIVSVLVR